MEVIMYLQYVGGRANVSDVEQNVRWIEKFDSSCGTLLKFLEQRPHIFALSADNEMVTAISRSINPETTKRAPLPRDKSRQRQTPAAHGKVGSMCVAASIDLEELQRRFKRLDYSSVLATKVLHVTNRGPTSNSVDLQGNQDKFDLFVFSYGSLVWWGTDISSFRMIENDFLRRGTALEHVIKDRYRQSCLEDLFPFWCTFAVASEDDIMQNGRFLEALQRDHILLTSDSPPYKQAISHALAQSAKLDVVEPMILELLRICKPLPLQIRDQGHANISHTRVNQLKGELFLYRMELRSDSELLEEPEFFWELPWFKPGFKMVRDDYGIDSRVMQLDEKLSAAQLTLSMIGEQFDEEHGRRLEWIIIVLILIEVVIAVIELLLEVGLGFSLPYSA